MDDHGGLAPGAADATTYSKPARIFHWITAAVVFVMVPVGLWMSYRGNTLNLWDGLTNGLYSGHKLTGFLLLWLIVARLVYRFRRGAPPDEPSLLWWHKAASHATHWLLYGLLLVVPILGWIGVSLYPSLDVFGLFKLPALAKPNEDAAAKVLSLHGTLALLLAAVACAHIGAALYHHLIRKDGVLRRMMPPSR
jgi:cytochrome b561